MNDLKKLKKKAFFSSLSLFFQSGYSAILGLIANLILTIILSPKIFGIYITLLSTISFLNYFSDIGLAASLIQKKEISDDDVKSVFTFQQILILSLISIGFLLGEFIVKFYRLPNDGLYLYYSLLISFFISSLKTVPSIFLERKIQYQKIVLVQVVENTFFYLTVIVFALLNFELKSFIIGVLSRSIIGLILIYYFSPWQPRVGLVKENLKQLLSFGLPFQTSSFLALFKDDLIILYLGKVIGFESVGYIGWAKKWAEAPIRIIMDNITKILFPLVARLQENKEKISFIINKILYYQTLIILPLMILSFFLMPHLVYIIPKYQKWEPALHLFRIFVFSSFLVIYSAPFVNIFNAIGKVKISFNLMLFWTIITWLLTPTLTKIFDIFGFPLTHLIISFTFFLVVSLAKKYFSFSFFSSIKKPLFAGLVMIFILLLIQSLAIKNLYLLTALLILSGNLTYYFVLTFIFKFNLKKEIEYFFSYEK